MFSIKPKKGELAFSLIETEDPLNGYWISKELREHIASPVKGSYIIGGQIYTPNKN